MTTAESEPDDLEEALPRPSDPRREFALPPCMVVMAPVSFVICYLAANLLLNLPALEADLARASLGAQVLLPAGAVMLLLGVATLFGLELRQRLHNCTARLISYAGTVGGLAGLILPQIS
ncbi:hypothetical protein [Pseudoroseicyclus sp. CXY001]|uniref:hypothetical protein n=1 Tax=Pseudoroseicyclus sp. CXY001 TaxID=3242492 RepID=UPI00358DD4D4